MDKNTSMKKLENLRGFMNFTGQEEMNPEPMTQDKNFGTEMTQEEIRPAAASVSNIGRIKNLFKFGEEHTGSM